MRRAYRQFPIDPKDYDLLGFRYQAKLNFDTPPPVLSVYVPRQ